MKDDKEPRTIKEIAEEFRKGDTKPNKFERHLVRTYLAERSIRPIEKIYENYERAIKAFEDYRGDNEKAHYGAQYLAIASKMLELMARYTYPSLKPIDDPESQDMAKEAPLAIDARVVREIVMRDPMAHTEHEGVTRVLLPMGVNKPVNDDNDDESK